MSWEIAVTLAFGIGAFIFAYLYANSDEDNKFLKILFLGASILMSLSTLAIQDDIITSNNPTNSSIMLNALHSNYNMQIWVFRIVIISVFVYLLYGLFTYSINKTKKM